jgi:hypothetical protein
MIVNYTLGVSTMHLFNNTVQSVYTLMLKQIIAIGQKQQSVIWKVIQKKMSLLRVPLQEEQLDQPQPLEEPL